MKTGFRRNVAALLSLALPLAGCMAFQHNAVRQFPSFPPARTQGLAGPHPTLAIQASFQVVGLNVTNDMRQTAVDHFTAWAEDAYRQAGYFTMQRDASSADYRLVLRVRDDGSPNFALAILAGFTMLVVPAVASDQFTTEGDLVTKAGNVLGTYRTNHSMTTVMEILLMFGMPFAWPRSVEKEMWTAITRDMAVWSEEQVARLPAGRQVSLR